MPLSDPQAIAAKPMRGITYRGTGWHRGKSTKAMLRIPKSANLTHPMPRRVAQLGSLLQRESPGMLSNR